MSIIWELRDVLANVVIERQKSLFSSQHWTGGCELLGDRTHVKNRFRRKRNSEFEVGHAVTFSVDKVTVPYHTKCAARRICLVVSRKNQIHSFLATVRRKCGDPCKE